MNKDARWFRHDADASADPKLKALRRRNAEMAASLSQEEILRLAPAWAAWAAMGWYWHILGCMRSEADYKLEDSEMTVEGLADDFSMTNDIMANFLKTCKDVVKLFEKNGNYFYAKRLNGDMERLEQLRQQKSDAGKASALKRYGKPEGKELSVKVAEFLKIYEAEIGIATPPILESLKDMSETYSVDDFRKAVTGTDRKKRNLRYIEKALEGGPKETVTENTTSMKVNE